MQNPLHTTYFSLIVKSESLNPGILFPPTSPPPRAAAALREGGGGCLRFFQITRSPFVAHASVIAD